VFSLGLELGFAQKRNLTLVIIGALIFISWGWFDQLFSFRILDLVDFRTVVGAAGVWVGLNFWKNRF